MTGHTLLWHRQQPDWFFKGLTPKDPASIKTLRGRLKAHIEAMIERYDDVVDNWDVVNEAISDDPAKTYRDSGSKWWQFFGDEDYIYWAFKYARDALEAKGAGHAAGRLYYNDYSETQKVDKILKMTSWLETKGIKIDGIGFQSHWQLEWPPVDQIEGTLKKVTAAGYKVKISELDLTVYNDYPPPNFTFLPAPEGPFTDKLEAKQAARYAALFALFRKHKASLSSVTVWGFSDEQSWLNHEPVPGRRDYPLLFDDAHQPKDALKAIQSF